MEGSSQQRGRSTGTDLSYQSDPPSLTGMSQAPGPSTVLNTAANYLLGGQQPLAIPVSTNPSQGLRKVLVKPIAPKQPLPPGVNPLNVIPGLVAPPPINPANLPNEQYQQQSTVLPNIQTNYSSINHPISPTYGNGQQQRQMSPPHNYLASPTSDTDKSVPSLFASQSKAPAAKRRSSSQSSSSGVVGVSVPTNKPRKPCNCKNSQCLKLYCDCFANGEFCRESCNCQNCKNSFQHEEDRARAVKVCLERNPNAFKPKVGHGRIGDERRHIKGCNCKKSSCLKNYCECYEAKIPCSHLCRCVGCQNLADRPEGKGLMQLANAADLRTQQQKAASSHFLEHLEMFPPQFVHSSYHEEGQRLPYSFVNKDVAKATALCLLEEASHCASSGKSQVEVERAVLIEFGRCLEQIINSSESANQTHREPVTGKV